MNRFTTLRGNVGLEVATASRLKRTKRNEKSSLFGCAQRQS
jgi:hypothetical protein